jgi:ribosome-interacting GTPase 1
MPANLTPEYFKAEQWYREATTNEEKILATERMLAVMPKHKGTDHLKADLRRRLSKLKEAPTKKAGTKHADIFYIQRSGVGQVVLLGTPSCGKSSIVAALTNAKVNVADFPFATTNPVPGMLMFENVQIQLVDMPPITADYVAPGQVGTYRNCDLIAIVIDLSADVAEQMRICIDFLESRSLLIDVETPAIDQRGNMLGRRVFCICTKSDIAKPKALKTLKKSCPSAALGAGKDRFEYIEISTQTGAGIDKLPETLFRLLRIIRVYAKPPGKKPDMDEPFTLPAGSTVMDLATAIHRELTDKLKFARIWGTGVYSGQNVQLNHVLHDEDIIELHFN